MQKVVILIPTYNELENINLLVPEIFALHPDVRALVIDDNSPDGTSNAVRTLMKQYPNLALLTRMSKDGLGVAYKAGIAQVLKDPEITHVVTMDADGSHPAEYLRALFSFINTNELVIGSRYVVGGGIEGWEMWRFFLSKFGNLYARTITMLPIKDITAGFMVFSADTLRKIDFTCMQASGYSFLMELKFIVFHTMHGKVTEVPILFKNRREGESKISRHIINEGLKTPWRLTARRIMNKRVVKIKFSIMQGGSPIRCIACGSDKYSPYSMKGEYTLYQCSDCGHVVVLPIPENLSEVYDGEYFTGAKKGFGYVSYDRDKEPMHAVFEKSLIEAESLLGGVGTLVDVGAATGFFIKIALSRGWNSAGVELSAFAAKKARDSGLDVRTGTLIQNYFPQKSADLVTLWDVIEHMPNPVEDLEQVRKVLRKDGILLINTPDVGSLYARILKSRWHLIVPPEHIHYFNKKSIRLLLEESGFRVESISTMDKSFTLEYVVQILARWLDVSFIQYLVEWLENHPTIGRLSMYINLRDNMFIVARKI